LVARHHVHVVDPDPARRARIARELYSPSIHAEIYESVEELVSRAPTHGSLLIADQEPADAGESLGELWSQSSYLPAAFYSEKPSPQKIVQAMLSGALDYLEWPFCTEALDRSVKRLQRQGEQIAKVVRRKAEASQLVATLTRRERDVLEGLLEGESNKGIAKKLGLSPRTVEIHRANMMARLNAQSTSDAVRIGIYAGLGDQPATG
jgi:two-component system, LuxR family, response regulator FixJ